MRMKLHNTFVFPSRRQATTVASGECDSQKFLMAMSRRIVAPSESNARRGGSEGRLHFLDGPAICSRSAEPSKTKILGHRNKGSEVPDSKTVGCWLVP
jgi:hypothetical protein